MARDIEEFLKQAAQRRQEKLRQRKQQPGQPQPVQPQPVQPQQPQQPRQFQPPPRPPTPRPAAPQPPERRLSEAPRSLQDRQDVEIIEARDASGGLHQRHVEDTIDTRSIARHADQLGDQLELVDEHVDARIHKKFDNEIGHLRAGNNIADDRTFVDTSDNVAPIARELFKVFQSPQGVQQAIILAEILKRPEFD